MITEFTSLAEKLTAKRRKLWTVQYMLDTRTCAWGGNKQTNFLTIGSADSLNTCVIILVSLVLQGRIGEMSTLTTEEINRGSVRGICKGRPASNTAFPFRRHCPRLAADCLHYIRLQYRSTAIRRCNVYIASVQYMTQVIGGQISQTLHARQQHCTHLEPSSSAVPAT